LVNITLAFSSLIAITETMGDCDAGTSVKVNLRIEGEFPLIQETLELTIATSRAEWDNLRSSYYYQRFALSPVSGYA
jgi:hypothetical protein